MSEEMQDQIDAAYLQKILNLVDCEDKGKRKSALKSLREYLSSHPSLITSSQSSDQVVKTVLRCFRDPAEACRELAVTILHDVVAFGANVPDLLSVVMPVLTPRLGGCEIIEPSEEVRHLLVDLLRKIIVKSSCSILPYFNDIIQVLLKTIVDPFPKIKKESCECVSDLSNAIPQHFHMQSESLVKPLLQTLNHQQYKIRVSCVMAIGVVVCKGNNKAIKEVSGPLAERLFDQTQQVREAVSQVIGDWMVNLPDRYSYFHIMIPLLLTSLNDTSPSIQELAWMLWNQAGYQWEQENEDDIKDKLDFLDQPPPHYPKNIRRPNMGCRSLVKRHLHKISPALLRELEDWLVDVRLKASQLLCVLIVNLEADVAQYAEQLLQGMYRACGDEDVRIVENVEQAAYLMGHFFSCDNYWALMQPMIQDSCNSGQLRILSALMNGTEARSLVSHIITIANVLQHCDIRQSRETDFQFQLLKCCFALFDVCGNSCIAVSQQIFNIIVTVHGLAASDTVSKKAEDALECLRCLENLETISQLYEKYMGELLCIVSSQTEIWTVHSAERCIFQDLMLHSGPALGGFLEAVVPVLRTCLNPNNPDSEMKLKIMSTVATVIQNSDQTHLFPQSESFLFSIIKDVIAPNLVWNAGRTAEALRTITVSCLLTLLQSHTIQTEEIVSLLLKSTIPLLIAIVEDASRKTRLYTCQSLLYIVSLALNNGKLECDDVHKIYGVILKRLDDVDDRVRKVAVEVLHKMFTSLPVDYNVECSSAHIEALFSTLLVHLDDSDTDFGLLILGVLKDICYLNPCYLAQKLESLQEKFRNQKACDDLICHLVKKCNISVDKLSNKVC